ncbi:MAG: phosphoglycerate mutase [Betaproteobacteria bacterium]|nr:phosphoglycerate mutase [Betaproteobacteria bacterium]
MHCELVVPALFAAREVARLPALELLLARGRVAREQPLSLEPWLAQAFGLAESSFPAGAITAFAAGENGIGSPGDFCWLRADPVHLRIERDRLSLIPSAGFSISRDEAEAFGATLNRHFGDVLAIVPCWPDRWCLRSAGDVALDALAPIELAGQEVDANLPRGPQTARWHALLNEVQMALHDHPVNVEREQRGEPAVNSVWFWGAGRLPGAARGPWHSVTADDPLATGLARLAGLRHRALPATANDWLERVPENGRHLVVLDALRGALALGGPESHGERLAAMEARWFAPLLEALRRGRIGMITVRASDAGASHETVRGDLRRFWRRMRPLAAYT